MTSCRSGNRATPVGPWKHGPIPVVGLIGKIGSGKSAVAAILAARGGAVIDADRVGHELLREPAVRQEVVTRFGETVLDRRVAAEARPAQIDRQALGAIVFADPGKRHELEAILHPLMRDRFRREIERISRQGEARLIVLDAAILLEAGWDELCDCVAFVDAPDTARSERVAKQRGWTIDAMRRREAAQWPSERKRLCADIVLTNDSDFDSLDREVGRLDELLSDLSSRTRGCAAPEAREGAAIPTEMIG